MKKQFLFFTIFVLAIFAGSSKVFGQQLTGNIATCPVPTAIDPTCISSDAFHPIPGTPYMYEITVPNIAAGSGEYTWYVTQDPNFVAAGVLNNATADGVPGNFIAGIGAGGGTYNNSAASGTNQIEIIWNSFAHDPANPVFVVIQVRGTDAADCPVNNLKVYVIEPVNAFTLDIAAVTDAAAGSDVTYGATAVSCFPDVVSATWDATNAEVDYDFGTSYLYFMVTAANYTTSWRPSFQVSGIDGAIQEVALDWALSSTPTAWNNVPFTGTAPDYNGIYTDAAVIVDVQDASGTVGAAGECILVRLTVTHNHYEGIVDQPITVAVDGETQLAMATPMKDVHHVDCSDDGFTNDVATHTLESRPDVQDNTAPASDDFLPIGPDNN